MIRLENLSKTYKNKLGNNNIFNDINISFNDKGLYYILGDNGTGKSTIFNILLGKDLNYNGDYYFQDTNITKLNSKKINNFRNKNISVITQSTNLIKELNVYDNLLIALNDNKKTLSQKKKLITNVLSSVKLSGFENRKVNTLSGGEAQRIAIARSIINKPKVLLADEITSNLDLETAKTTMDLLQELSKDYLIIMITHNKLLVEEYKGIAYEIKDKTIVNVYNPKNIVDKPLNLEKNKSSFKNFVIIIKSLLKDKMVINILHVVMIFISLISINMLFISLSSSPLKVKLKSLYDNGLEVIQVDYHKDLNQDIFIKTKKISPLYFPNTNGNNYNIKQIVLIDDYLEKFKITGHLPKNKNEILVTDYYVSKSSLTAEDLLNSSFEFRINEQRELLTITGIIKTNYQQLLNKPTSHTTNQIIELNTNNFYNSFFVKESLFFNYKAIENDFLFNLSDNININIQTRNKISENADILFGNKAINLNEISLTYYNIKELFNEYENIEYEDLEDVYNEIKNKTIKYYFFDYNNLEYIEYELTVVGINKIPVSSNGVSEELLAKLTKKEVDEDYLFKVDNNVYNNSKTIRKLEKSGAVFHSLNTVTTQELDPNYSKASTFLQVNIILSILFSMLFIVIGVIITTIYNKNQKENIETFNLIGLSENTIGVLYFIITFIKMIPGVILAVVSSSLITNYLNKFVSSNTLQITYKILLNQNIKIIIFLTIITLITSLISFLLTIKHLRKGVKTKTW